MLNTCARHRQSPRRIGAGAALALALWALGGCAYHAQPPASDGTRSLLQLSSAGMAPVTPAPSPGVEATQTGATIAALAEEMIGVPYVWGGRTPRGFDCSGLVYYAHRRAGVRVPRTSRAQYRAARAVALEDAKPGDLLFFRSPNYSHVAIYLGEGVFVHAPSSGKHVTRARLGKRYYRERLVGVGRLHGF